MSNPLQDLERKLLAAEEENRIMRGALDSRVTQLNTERMQATYTKDCIRDGLHFIRNHLAAISAQVDAAAKLLYVLEQHVFPQTLPPAPPTPEPTTHDDHHQPRSEPADTGSELTDTSAD